ncbi:MAG: DUF1573 domain-containing protein [Bacteroidales bacterium]
MKNKISLSSIYVISVLLISSFFTNTIFAQSTDAPEFEYVAEDNRIVLDTIFLDWINDVELEIEFINEGDKPLIVQSVTGCCGTQITDWTRKPLMSGQKGTISVEFSVPPRPHKISRTIKTISNDPDGVKTLHIVGIVVEPKEKGTIELR